MNARIDDTTKYPVHPMNATYMANMDGNAELHPDWGDWSTNKYGIPWQSVTSTQAMVPMKFSDADESDPGPYPFPSTARIEPGDGHVLILDTSTCWVYETYLSDLSGSSWSCSSGAKFNLASDVLRTDGWTSADAAGLSVFAGLVKLSEVQAGAIHHAIRFSVSKSQNGYIHPATHAAGDSNTSYPPMGLRMRLKASFSLSKLTGPSLIVATALQQYGVILADNGSNWYITGDSDDGWKPLMDDLVSQLGSIKGNDFEAVQTGSISTAGL